MISEQNLTNKNLKDIKPGQWILVKYKGEYFLDIVQKMQKFSVWNILMVFQDLDRDLEKVTRAVWYPSERLFDAAVVPNVV